MAAALLVTLACAACTTNSAPGPSAAASGSRPTVAFESIDGPPESIFSRMVQTLSHEAEARRLAVVSRSNPAHFRVKVYTATVVYPKKSVVHWVWDVYDADQRRAYRLTGEEPVTGAGRSTWAAVDDQVVRKIAKTGMDRLVAFLAAPPPPRPSTPAGTPAQAPAPAIPSAPSIDPGATVMAETAFAPN